MGLISTVFGWLGGNKDIVKDVADVVQDYKPGVVTEHKMDVETTKVEDASQDSARKYDAPQVNDRFNNFVNGLNRLPRPILAFWAIGILVGLLPIPAAVSTAPPLILNIIWTVIGFYFGIRTVSQDIPTLIKAIKNA